jgi:hypothetical protein
MKRRAEPETLFSSLRWNHTTEIRGASSIHFLSEMCRNLFPTLLPCSSECVIHRIALRGELVERISDSSSLSTRRDESASSADVGSRRELRRVIVHSTATYHLVTILPQSSSQLQSTILSSGPLRRSNSTNLFPTMSPRSQKTWKPRWRREGLSVAIEMKTRWLGIRVAFQAEGKAFGERRELEYETLECLGIST